MKGVAEEHRVSVTDTEGVVLLVTPVISGFTRVPRAPDSTSGVSSLSSSSLVVSELMFQLESPNQELNRDFACIYFIRSVNSLKIKASY